MRDSLPITRNITPAYVASLVIVLLVVIAAASGLLGADAVYPTEEMRLRKMPTDLLTLLVGMPLLLVSLWLARRKQLAGLLLWPGVLVYVLYIYLSYAAGVPLSALFPIYLALVALSAYTAIGLVASIDAGVVRGRLEGRVPARAAGGILIALAILFTLLNLSYIVAALGDPQPEALLDYPVWIVDSTIMAPLWLLGGIMLWRRSALGYVGGTGLYFLGSLLFLGAMVVLAFPAIDSGQPVDVAGIVLMLVIGMVCFIPLALFVRGSSAPDRD